MATFESEMSVRRASRGLRLSAVHLAGLGISTLLGVVAGSAFYWAAPERAWNIFLAGFLWTMIVAAGTALVRCVRERLPRGAWVRGIAMGCEMTFPLTTLYMLAVALLTLGIPADEATQVGNVMLAARPDFLAVAPVFYAASLVLGVVVGPVYVLTSPFRRT